MLDEFERALLGFASLVDRKNTFFLNDPRIRIEAIKSALNAVNKIGKLLQGFNEVELHALKQLLHYHMNPDYASEGIALPSVVIALETLAESKLKSSESENPSSIVRSQSGRTKDSAFAHLASAATALLQRHGVIINRSDNKNGAKHISALMVECFDLRIATYLKFDAKGAELKGATRPVYEITTSEIAKKLPGYLDQYIRDISSRKLVQGKPLPVGRWFSRSKF